MCVICIAENGKRPSEKMVRDMWKKNSHGGGFAERWTDEKGKVWVKWAKNLNLEEMIAKCATAPLPYVAHFRIASTNGGDQRPSLCHPFEVSESPSEALEGMTDNAVLFHNGDWKDWRTYLIQACFKYGYQMPPGKFSDTRCMAFISNILGPYFMDFIEQKGVTFGPDWYEVHWGAGEPWKKVGDLLCSNDKFVTYTPPVNQSFHQGRETRNGSDAGSNNHSPTKCRARDCGASISLAQNGACDKHSHMRPSPRLSFPARQANGVDICMDCGKAIKVANDHAVSCKHAPKIDSLGASVCKVVCKACKKELKTGNEHDPDCRFKPFGKLIELGQGPKGLAGGEPIPDPFQLVLAADKAREEGKISKKVFGRIREKWGYTAHSWNWAKMERGREHITH